MASTKTASASSLCAADTDVENAPGCKSAWSGGGGGENEVDLARTGAPTDKATLGGKAVVANTSSSPIEVGDGTKRNPSTPETGGKKKQVHCGDIGAVSWPIGGNVDVNPTREATGPAFSPYPEAPGIRKASSAGETRGSPEEDPGGRENNRTTAVGAEAAAGTEGGSSVAALIAARPGSATNQCFVEVDRIAHRNQGTDREEYRTSPSYGTTTIAEPQSTGSNSKDQDHADATVGASGQLVSSRSTHEPSPHRQEPDLRTSSSTVLGNASGELGGELVPEGVDLRAIRLTAIAVSDAIFGDAVATTIAAQSRAADFAPSGSNDTNALGCTR